MKILEFSRSYYPVIGGLEKFISNRLKLYSDLNYNYELITTDYLLGNEKLPRDGINRIKQFSKFNFTFEINKLNEIKNKEYDIISVNQIGNFISDYLLLSEFRSDPIKILTPHFYFHTNNYKYLKYAYGKLLARRVLNIVDRMICFTETEAKFWIDEFGFTRERITIIPHYYNPSSIISNLRNDEYILFIGRNAPNKRIDLLLEAWQSSSLKSRLIIVGAENIQSESDKIEIKGIVSDNEKKDLLQNCSALILPTDHEAFAYVLLEASSFKKPIICSDLPVFSNVLDKAGFISFRNNARSLIEAVKKFEGLNSTEREKIGEINFKNLDRYSYENILNHHRIFFENIL